MKIIHVMVYFGEDPESKELSKKAAPAYEAQVKIKELFGVTDYRVYTNLKIDREHFIYLDNIPHLHLSGKDRLKGNKIPLIREALRSFSGDEILLFHDFDCFQNGIFERYPDVVYERPITLTGYNHKPTSINTGVMFCRGGDRSADGILGDVIDDMLKVGRSTEEGRFTEIYRSIPDMFGLLGAEWNFGKHRQEETFRKLNEYGRRVEFCHCWPPFNLKEFINLKIMDERVGEIIGEAFRLGNFI